MDKAVIFGTFEFVGFHFCMRLLEKGIEVIGINHPQQEKEDYLTDKRLTIGRNANFSEFAMEQWLPVAEINEQTLVIIDYYDYYIHGVSGFFNKYRYMEDFFQRNIHQIKETHSSIIQLLPIQWAASREEKYQFLPIKQVHQIYLPTIYGPWQPEIFLFQQALLQQVKKVEQLFLNEREWTEDAIYIDDVVHESLTLISSPPGKFLLKSEFKDQWYKCAQSLAIPIKELSFHESSNDVLLQDIQVKFIKNKRDVSEGMEEQKKHMNLFVDG